VPTLKQYVKGSRTTSKGFLGTPAVYDLPSYAASTGQVHPAHTFLTTDYVAAAHRLKGAHGKRLRVNTWTVNDAAGAARVDGFGVGGIITNNRTSCGTP
jgi:glycerophosphoryl diester phosphodiesterase